MKNCTPAIPKVRILIWIEALKQMDHNCWLALVTYMLLFPYYSLSTQTQGWGTAAPLVLPSCQPAKRVRKSWSCCGKPSTGDSSSLSDNLLPRVSTTSSPGTTFTTRPTWTVAHNGMHITDQSLFPPASVQTCVLLVVIQDLLKFTQKVK